MENTGPLWLTPVAIGGAVTLGGLAVAYNPAARAALGGFVGPIASAASATFANIVESGDLERVFELAFRGALNAIAK